MDSLANFLPKAIRTVTKLLYRVVQDCVQKPKSIKTALPVDPATLCTYKTVLKRNRDVQYINIKPEATVYISN